ncbi:hypothetical protein AB4Z52_30810 [Rhizobium sp. 2YAF20]|uniref:hypothetical protein n=1 Tax=Rhizobium sp. 2YAF20 TaxID=3233027 RepID=UPI003F9E294A
MTIVSTPAGPDLSVERLEKIDEPASLIALRMAVDARLPRLDLPELILEMHARTGFADLFTHASEGSARAEDVDTVADLSNFATTTRNSKTPNRLARLSFLQEVMAPPISAFRRFHLSAQ